jgi:transcriptional regulator with XRE-family HTH domain
MPHVPLNPLRLVPPPRPDPVATLLAAHRGAAGLSQNGLARATGLNAGYICLIEQGQRHPSRQVVLTLADALHLDMVATDRLLFAAGHATVIDWQEVCTQVTEALPLGIRDLTEQIFLDVLGCAIEAAADAGR